MNSETGSTKDTIINTARSIFARKGFKGTTTAEIARSVGISEGTIYRHFESKEELMMECIKPIFDYMLKNAQNDIFSEASNLRELIYKGLEIRLKLFEENYDIFRILFNELPYSEEMINHYMKYIFDHEDKVNELMGKMDELGTLERSRNFFLFMLGQIMSLWMYINFKDWSCNKNIDLNVQMLEISEEHILDDLTDFILYGLSGKPETQDR